MRVRLRLMGLAKARRMSIIGGMKFADVLAALNESRGKGLWQEVAREAGVHYDTVARIARRDMPTPSVQVVESLAAALDKLGIKPPAEAPVVPAEHKAAA